MENRDEVEEQARVFQVNAYGCSREPRYSVLPVARWRTGRWKRAGPMKRNKPAHAPLRCGGMYAISWNYEHTVVDNAIYARTEELAHRVVRDLLVA